MTKSDTKTVTRRMASELAGLAPATLKKMALEGRGPIFTKIGTTQQSRTLYAVAEIQKWQRDPAAYERRHRGQRHDRRHNAGK